MHTGIRSRVLHYYSVGLLMWHLCNTVVSTYVTLMQHCGQDVTLEGAQGGTGVPSLQNNTQGEVLREL